MNSEDLEFLGPIKSKRLTSLSEDSKNDQVQIRADQEYWEKYGTNRSKKSTKSKSEIMEELSRERFPWED